MKQPPLYIAGVMQIGATTLEGIWQCVIERRMHLPSDPAVRLGIYLRHTSDSVEIYMCPGLLIAPCL